MNLKYDLKETNFHSIFKDYNFDQRDVQILKDMASIVKPYTSEFLKGFYEHIFEFKHARIFISNQEIHSRHQSGIEQWFNNLFRGHYDQKYCSKLYNISETHVKISLPAHYVNAAFSYTRGFLRDVLIKEDKLFALPSLDKIIDINLDILTFTYNEGEQSKLVEDIFFLKNAVEKESIEPYVQPIFNAQTMKVEKYECLMRLFGSDSANAISVFPYLEIAKKIKLYKSMMEIMIDKSFALFHGTEQEFSVNLGYEDISNSDFREFIFEKIRNYSNPEKIIFEILETDFIEDFSIVKDFAASVRIFGCRLAIDDFGSGYSSMENILALKPEFIKIDASLIKNIDNSAQSKTIVKNIVNMAHELDTKTVAEYVHSKEVLDIVKELEVDFLQGFYLSEPMAWTRSS